MATELETTPSSQALLGSPEQSGVVNTVTDDCGGGVDHSNGSRAESDVEAHCAQSPPIAEKNEQRLKAEVAYSAAWESEQEHDSDSDFVVEDLDESEDAEMEDDDSDSDYSGSNATKRRKKRRGGNFKKGARDDRRRERPDNEMTRKLRSQRKQADSMSAEEEGEEDNQSERDDVEMGKQEPSNSPVLTDRLDRDVPKELARIRGMWEMAEILEFLHVFKSVLQMPTMFSADALEEAIVQSPGPGLLASIHMGLLRGISPRSQINEETWTIYLASKLLAQHIREGKRAELHFAPQKGHEMEEYAALSSTNRVGALKALCEMRGDRDDVRGLIETVLKPKKAKEQQLQKGKGSSGRNGVVHHTLDDFRRVPYGEGSNGEKYWLLDMWGSCGIRMYKETFAGTPSASLTTAPPMHTAPRTRGRGRGRGRGGGRGRPKKSALPSLGGSLVSEGPPCGLWEVAASSMSELESLGEDLIGTRKRKCAALSKRIFHEIIPELQNRELAEERKRKQAEKLRVNLGNVILDNDGGYGRSRRKRKEISYRFDEYDRMIDEGINASDVQELDIVEPPPVRAAAQPEKNLADIDLDAVQKGFRRGRSAAGLLSSAPNDENMIKDDLVNGIDGGGLDGIVTVDGMARGEQNDSKDVDLNRKQALGPDEAARGRPPLFVQVAPSAEVRSEEGSPDIDNFSQPLKKRRAYFEGCLEEADIKRDCSDDGESSKIENSSRGKPDCASSMSEEECRDDEDMMGDLDIESE